MHLPVKMACNSHLFVLGFYMMMENPQTANSSSWQVVWSIHDLVLVNACVHSSDAGPAESWEGQIHAQIDFSIMQRGLWWWRHLCVNCAIFVLREFKFHVSGQRRTAGHNWNFRLTPSFHISFFCQKTNQILQFWNKKSFYTLFPYSVEFVFAVCRLTSEH